ncbi:MULTISPECIES: hypothetical protein [unclassified Chryseobacterium]|uniref:C1q-like domain-containing protein n=1 Tax=unclassified Chryseobacterium TaxID=2593645 RepID=UPI0009543C8E|nr:MULTISPECIES: hypothetical protein [unclassified Chryseobacterium]SIR55919.1 C1q domain-containing protein [Chryseobacterium sp. RU33C]
MKKKIILFFLLFFLSQSAFSQVGINTQFPKATLDIAANKTDGSRAEGLIAPRLTGDQIKAGNSQYGTAQTGAIIYATLPVTTADAKTANITDVGYYYFDGTTWRKINSNLYNSDGTITTNRNVNMGNNNLVFTGSGKIGVGNSTPKMKLDTRKLPGNSSPGEGAIAIGETTTTADTAGAGAIRYNSSGGGKLEYSNGVKWNTLKSIIQKSMIVANLQNNTFNFENGGVSKKVTGWIESVDVNNNFNPTTGVFTCPRDGNYVVSVALLPVATLNIPGSFQVEIVVNGTSINAGIKSSVAGNLYCGATISGIVHLNSGDTVNINYFHDLGTNRLNHTADFNTLSITEL